MDTVAPNPMVGCVIVEQDEIIGEGYTSAYGGPHAEVNAIESVRDKSRLGNATLYVSLEPCSHFGKTPPCADLIIKHNISQVVIGVKDPHTKVAGSGILKLEQAGCKVQDGILEEECIKANHRFFTYHQKKRPYIILKWAQTTDGFIAPRANLRNSNPEPYWITNSYSQQLVHQWRSQEQAILVGTNTVMEDDPQLSSRKWYGNSPLRVVLDRKLSIPSNFKIYDRQSPTLVLTEQKDMPENQKRIKHRYLDFNNNPAQQICEVLWEEQILSVLIEGGTKTLNTFIESDLWDEARVFTGNTSFKEGIKAPKIHGSVISQSSIGTDELKIIAHD